MKAERLPRIPLTRVDFAADSAGLAPSLIAAIESEGGLWWAGDAYTSAKEAIAAARLVGAVALRLDFRDLSLLRELPLVRYLHIRTDGRPPLDPAAALPGLRALIVHSGALRGRTDPADFPELKWLRIPLGGKGGAAILPAIQRGHPRLEWLALREVKARSVADLCPSFPQLRVLRIGYADHLRRLGSLSAIMPHLRKLSLELTQIRELDGLGDLHELETLEVFGGRVRDLTPLALSHKLRYARLELPDLESIEPLRNHPSLRMLALTMAREPDVAVLESMPKLVAVRRGKGFDKPSAFPDLSELAVDDPLRVEWSLALRE